MDHLAGQVEQWRSGVAAVLELADDRKDSTIEVLLRKSDLEAGPEALLGQEPTAGGAARRYRSGQLTDRRRAPGGLALAHPDARLLAVDTSATPSASSAKRLGHQLKQPGKTRLEPSTRLRKPTHMSAGEVQQGKH